MTEDKKQPAIKTRMGAINATTWENTHEKGAFYKTTFRRSYKIGEEWKESDQFDENDLPKISLLATRHFEEIQKLKQTTTTK